MAMIFSRRATLLAMLAPFPAAAQLGGILDRLGAGKTKSGDSSKNGAGIKEALLTGVSNAVGLAGMTDGFFLNSAIKILLPSQMKPVETGLRMVGQSKMLDDLVLGMNRAAEHAAPAAKSIFGDAIKEMSVTDAMGILRGGDTAATDFLKKTSSDKLTAAFRPPISESMQMVGAIKAFDDVMQRFKGIPFMKADPIDIEGHVTGKAVDGLFYLVGQEEKQIRTNPAAQVTPLLKDVFGGLMK
jgi:Protein of unknown function (DUF4197)